jgi:hypothetical protein
MDLIGLLTFGYITSKKEEPERINNKKIKTYNRNYYDMYNSDEISKNKEIIYKLNEKNYEKSIKKNTNVINKLWRQENDSQKAKKDKEILSKINKDLTNIVDKKYNKNDIISIETMANYKSDNDSNFSNDSEFVVRKKDNVKFLDLQDKMNTKIESDMESDDYPDSEPKYCNENLYNSQYEPMKLNHKGLPRTNNYYKEQDTMFRPNQNSFKEVESSRFGEKLDGRYGVDKDMTHNNMLPFFKSKTYGYNPERVKQMADRSTRNVELYTGSDQMLQFKHKQEVKQLFDPVVNKVDSVNGVPNFSDFFQSRRIASDKRQGEKPFQPVLVSPGLNLGYNQQGNSGIKGGGDIYRVLPKTVDQLRTVDKPKVSYSPPVIPGQKGNKMASIGDVEHRHQDRFFEYTKDSMMPTSAIETAPALYGQFNNNLTNRAETGVNKYLNPAQGVEKSTPEYLQGKFKTSFKKTFENTNNIGTVSNKQMNYFINPNNMNNSMKNTNREHMKPLTGTSGNYTSVPLINFINMIPEITKKEILLEDGGRKNISNVSNYIKGYLYNSINAIQDPTLRSIISENIIISNTTGNQDKSYLFNAENAVPENNMRNLSDNIQIANQIGNKEQGYLFNNLDSIPDTTLRELVNTVWGSGGLNFNGNHGGTYLYDYENNQPENTLRNLTENNKNINNVLGNHGGTYLYDYENNQPENTLRTLTENNKNINNVLGNHGASYLYDYENNQPENTLRNLTENNKNINNVLGNHGSSYLYDYKNNQPENTLRNLTENNKNINNVLGNHGSSYLYDYKNNQPENTLRNLTENNKNINNVLGNHGALYLYDYENNQPENTLRTLTENNKNINNVLGNRGGLYLYDYENNRPENTIRNLTENNKNINNVLGNSGGLYLYDYENNRPENTLRNMTENNKNINNVLGNHTQNILYDFDNATPETTMRELTEKIKHLTNIVGNFKEGQMYNYENGIRNTLKEEIEETKHLLNIGTSQLTKMKLFNYDDKTRSTLRELMEETKHIANIASVYVNKGKLYNFDDVPDITLRNMTENTKNIKGFGSVIEKQSRSRSDVNNALLNTQKEILLKNRDPVSVKNNKGKTTEFTDYSFKNDNNSSNRSIMSNYKSNVGIKNELYPF